MSCQIVVFIRESGNLDQLKDFIGCFDCGMFFLQVAILPPQGGGGAPGGGGGGGTPIAGEGGGGGGGGGDGKMTSV